MRLALRFAFHELNLHRLQLTVFGYNEAAIRLYERLGFTREGHVPRIHLLRDGQRYDMLSLRAARQRVGSTVGAGVNAITR